jgi:hypothetical protein
VHARFSRCKAPCAGVALLSHLQPMPGYQSSNVVLILLLLHVLVLTSTAACTTQPTTPSGAVSYSSSSCRLPVLSGGACSTVCDPKFVLARGNLTVTCTLGNWSTPSGLCGECQVNISGWLCAALCMQDRTCMTMRVSAQLQAQASNRCLLRQC